MLNRGTYLTMLVALFIALAACAPKPVPATTPSSTTAPAATAPSPSLTPEDAAWQKVVEAAKKEGVVTLYNFDFTGAVGDALSQAFQNKYGIKMVGVTGPGATLAERIRTEDRAHKNVADIFSTTPLIMIITENDGLSIDPGPLPVLAEKVWRYDLKGDPKGHMLVFSRSLQIPYINTNLVKQDQEPKSYKDFLSPQWKGKIVIVAPTLAPQFNYLYFASKSHWFLDDNYFRQLAQQDLKVVATVRDSQSAVVRGEAAIALPQTDGILGRDAANGAPIKAIDMEEGVIEDIRSAVMPLKDAPDPNATKVFINWFFSQEGQTIFNKLNASIGPRNDVPDFRPQKLEPKKVFSLSLSDDLEVVKMQNDSTLSTLMGLKSEK